MAERPTGDGTGPDTIDVIGELDPGIRTIIGELAEDAARASMEWTRAVAAKEVDPDQAMTHLANVLVFLENVLPNQADDVLRAVRLGLDELERITEGTTASGGLPSTT